MGNFAVFCGTDLNTIEIEACCLHFLTSRLCCPETVLFRHSYTSSISFPILDAVHKLRNAEIITEYFLTKFLEKPEVYRHKTPYKILMDSQRSDRTINPSRVSCDIEEVKCTGYIYKTSIYNSQLLNGPMHEFTI